MSEEFLDLSGMNLGDTFEPTVAQKGSEAELRIISFLKGTDKNGNDYIMPFFEVMDDPYCKEFGDYIPLPTSTMSPKELNNAKLKLAAFSQAFNFDLTASLDIKNDIVGRTGWVILGIGKDQEDQPINKVNKYVMGA